MKIFIADKKVLDERFGHGCSEPGCDCKGPLYVTSRCCKSHPKVAYDPETGALLFQCAECGAPIMATPVAELSDE